MAALGGNRGDDQLIAALADGDETALKMLYDRHAPWLTLRLSRRCGDPDVVDQAVQDAFVAIWRRPGRYEGRGEVAAWIWGIAIRRLIDLLRRRPRGEYVLPANVESEPSTEEQVLRLATKYTASVADLRKQPMIAEA